MRWILLLSLVGVAACGGAEALTLEQAAVLAAAVREQAGPGAGVELRRELLGLAAALDARRRGPILAATERVRRRAGAEPARLLLLLGDIETALAPEPGGATDATAPERAQRKGG
jgi:hypothetical protein